MDTRREFNIVIERDEEGFFVTSAPSLPGCHTQAKTLDALIKRMREAIELCLEASDDGVETMEFVGVQRLISSLTSMVVAP